MDHRVDSTTFPPNITRHNGNPGDEGTRKLWEQFSKVSEAEQRYRRALERHAEARRAESSASCEVGNAGEALRQEQAKLIAAIGAPKEPARGSPVESI